MFFPGPLNIFVPGDSAFMLLKCMCDNISTEKKKQTKEPTHYSNLSHEEWRTRRTLGDGSSIVIKMVTKDLV